MQELYQRSCNELSEEQCRQLQKVLDTYIDILTVKDEESSRTNLVQHNIDTGETRHICLSPRRLPLLRRSAAEKKIKEMLETDIIEPSNSP